MRVSLGNRGLEKVAGHRGACACVNWWWQLKISCRVIMTRHWPEQQGRTEDSQAGFKRKDSTN